MTQTQTSASCSFLRTSPDCALLTLVISSPPWCYWWICLPPDTCAWAIREPFSPWCLLAAPSPVVGLWAEVLAGDGAESLRVRRQVILGRQNSQAVGSGPVHPSFQASINFSKDCIKYLVSLLVSANLPCSHSQLKLESRHLSHLMWSLSG